MKRTITALVVLLLVVRAPGEVVSYEGNSFPDNEGWTRDFFCTPERWIDDGWFHQLVEPKECFEPPSGDRDSYSRPIAEFVGTEDFFVEWRVEAMGENSELLWGAPALLAAGSQGPVAYWFSISRDQVKFIQDSFVVVLFVDIEPDVPHTHRLEQHGEEQYIWYIDGQAAHVGVPGGPYPEHNPAIAWRAKSAFLTAEVRWSYIRYGDIPTDASFDFDSDEDVDLQDYYYVEECLGKDGPGIFGGPENDAGPGCRFADSDADGDVDLKDIAAFQNTFTGDGG